MYWDFEEWDNVLDWAIMKNVIVEVGCEMNLKDRQGID